MAEPLRKSLRLFATTSVRPAIAPVGSGRRAHARRTLAADKFRGVETA